MPNRIHLGAHVVPDLLGRHHRIASRDLNDRQTDHRLRLDRVDLGDLDKDVFERIGNELFHPSSGGSGPWRDDQRFPNDDLGILAPRHGGEVEESYGEQDRRECEDDRAMREREAGEVHGAASVAVTSTG